MALSDLPTELWGMIAKRLSPEDHESLFCLASTCRKWRRVLFSEVKQLNFSHDQVANMPRVLPCFPNLQILNIKGRFPDLSRLHSAVKLRKFSFVHKEEQPAVSGTPNERIAHFRERMAIRVAAAAALVDILAKQPLIMLVFPFYLLSEKMIRRLVSIPTLLCIDSYLDAHLSKFVTSRIRNLSLTITRSTLQSDLNLTRFTHLRRLGLWLYKSSKSELLDRVREMSPMPNLIIWCPRSMVAAVARLPVQVLALSGGKPESLEPLLTCPTLRYLRVKDLDQRDLDCMSKHPNAANLVLKKGV